MVKPLKFPGLEWGSTRVMRGFVVFRRFAKPSFEVPSKQDPSD